MQNPTGMTESRERWIIARALVLAIAQLEKEPELTGATSDIKDMKYLRAHVYYFPVDAGLITWELGIDCEPGPVRPGDFVNDVLKDLGLPDKDYQDETTSRFFGAWLWEFETTPQFFEAVKPQLLKRLKVLYENGTIRGGLCQEKIVIDVDALKGEARANETHTA